MDQLASTIAAASRQALEGVQRDVQELKVSHNTAVEQLDAKIAALESENGSLKAAHLATRQILGDQIRALQNAIDKHGNVLEAHVEDAAAHHNQPAGERLDELHRQQHELAKELERISVDHASTTQSIAPLKQSYWELQTLQQKYGCSIETLFASYGREQQHADDTLSHTHYDQLGQDTRPGATAPGTDSSANQQGIAQGFVTELPEQVEDTQSSQDNLPQPLDMGYTVGDEGKERHRDQEADAAGAKDIAGAKEDSRADSIMEDEQASVQAVTASTVGAQPTNTPVNVDQPTKKRKHLPARDGFCHHCKCTESSIWRSGPGGIRTLCNSCGRKWKKSKDAGGPDATSGNASSGVFQDQSVNVVQEGSTTFAEAESERAQADEESVTVVGDSVTNGDALGNGRKRRRTGAGGANKNVRFGLDDDEEAASGDLFVSAVEFDEDSEPVQPAPAPETGAHDTQATKNDQPPPVQPPLRAKLRGRRRGTPARSLVLPSAPVRLDSDDSDDNIIVAQSRHLVKQAPESSTPSPTHTETVNTIDGDKRPQPVLSDSEDELALPTRGISSHAASSSSSKIALTAPPDSDEYTAVLAQFNLQKDQVHQSIEAQTERHSRRQPKPKKVWEQRTG